MSSNDNLSVQSQDEPKNGMCVIELKEGAKK